MRDFDSPSESDFYEREIIRLFVHKDRRNGFIFKLDHGLRDALKDALHGHIEFDSRWETELAKKPDPQELYELMRAKGASEMVYVISFQEEDGKIKPLLNALEECIDNTSGTLIFCIEGQIAYHESNDIGRRLLHRTR